MENEKDFQVLVDNLAELIGQLTELVDGLTEYFENEYSTETEWVEEPGPVSEDAWQDLNQKIRAADTTAHTEGK